jgi:hypothetical protein
MPEHIVPPNGDDRIARVHGGDKRRRRTVRRTMMADFEHICMQLDAFGEESPFCFDPGIAGEQHPKALVLQDERNRVVVDRVLAADER